MGGAFEALAMHSCREIEMRCLFIIKKQGLYGCHGYSTKCSGLYNSAKFCSDMVREVIGIPSHLVLVDDNNDIDREVKKFKATVVFIEALWVVPEKFEILCKLHPKVIWIVRNHSALPFASQEGSAMDWFIRYSRIANVVVSCNDLRTNSELQSLGQMQALYLPNYYPPTFHPRHHHREKGRLDIGCFGAIRPLKNQLLQAVASIIYADKNSLKLHFHMNGPRIECGGESIAKNIRQLFDQFPQHRLCVYPWMSQEHFVHVLRKMDVSLQVSFSETFNVTTADAVMNDVPVVVSSEISWVHPVCWANATSSHSIMDGINLAMHRFNFTKENAERLTEYSEVSADIWRNALEEMQSI